MPFKILEKEGRIDHTQFNIYLMVQRMWKSVQHPEILWLRANKSTMTQYLVAMATSLDKLENKVEVHHWHVKCFHMVKRLGKSVQNIRRYSTKYAEPRRKYATQVPLECSPPKLLDRSSTKFYTISWHQWRYLIMHIYGIIPFCFGMTERLVQGGR